MVYEIIPILAVQYNPLHTLNNQGPFFSLLSCMYMESYWGLSPPNITSQSFPIGSMYGIFAYIWLKIVVNVGKCTSPMDPMALILFSHRMII